MTHITLDFKSGLTKDKVQYKLAVLLLTGTKEAMGSSYNSRCVATSYYAKEFNQSFSYNRLKKKHEKRKRKISGLMNADTNTPLMKM